MLLHVGLQNFVNLGEIETISSNVYSAPIKRLVKSADQEGRLVDHTEGRKTRSVISLKSGTIVLSCVESLTLKNRIKRIIEGVVEVEDDEIEEVIELAPEPVPVTPAPEPVRVAPPAPAAAPAAPARRGGRGRAAAPAVENVQASGSIIEDLP